MKENEILNSKNKEIEIKIGSLDETVKKIIHKNKSLNIESSDLKRENDELKLKQSTLKIRKKINCNGIITIASQV